MYHSYINPKPKTNIWLSRSHAGILNEQRTTQAKELARYRDETIHGNLITTLPKET